jgi:hypothetical protein
MKTDEQEINILASWSNDLENTNFHGANEC